MEENTGNISNNKYFLTFFQVLSKRFLTHFDLITSFSKKNKSPSTQIVEIRTYFLPNLG